MEMFENNFFSGLDQDTDPRVLKNSFYTDGYNITLFKDSEFGAVTPLGGTSQIYNTIGTNGPIIKIFATKFTTDYGDKDGLLIFSQTIEGQSKYVYVKSFILDKTFGFSSKLLYRYRTGDSFSESVEFIDCVSFKEKNRNVVYFTDRITAIKKIPCDITVISSLNLPFKEDEVIVTSNDIPEPTITSKSINGRVLAGSYQSAVRFINSKTNQTTRWSLLSNPLIIEDLLPKFQSKIASANVGRVTGYSYRIQVSYSGIDTDSYDYYQVAVVENNIGTGVTKLTANLLSPQPVSGDNFVLYNNDTYEERVPIEDIVVDDAQIKTVNSLTIKNNRLFLGGLTYRDLSVNNLEIALNNTLTKPFTYPVNTVAERGLKTRYDFGHFRGEVYRYGLVYNDDFGNWSPVKVIDFSSVVSNLAESGCVDFKFPSRKNKDFTIENTSGELEQLALRISEIEGHPSWAKGVALVRAKRKKNVQFQSPLIHTRFIQAAQANLIYPQGGVPVNEEAQIGSLNGTLVPKDFSDIYPKHYINQGKDGSVSDISYRTNQLMHDPLTGNERSLPSAAPSSKYVHVVFNQNNLYNFNNTLYNPYTFTDGDKLNVVDICQLTAYYKPASTLFNSFKYHPGFDPLLGDAQAWAEVPNKKWFYRGHNLSESSIDNINFIPANTEIVEYRDVVAGQDKVILLTPPENLTSGSFGDYSGVMATGLTTERVPTNQAMSLIVTNEAITDVVYYFTTRRITGYDLPVPYKLNGASVDNGKSSALPYGNSESTTYNSIGFITENKGHTPRTTGAVSIVNIERGLSDFRYGDEDSQYEFIWTGNYSSLPGGSFNSSTKVTFDVYGGDCSVDYHTFKISDSSFIPVGYRNDRDFSGNKYRLEKYGDRFNMPGNENREYNRFNPQKARSQTITVALESEFIGSLANPIEYNKTTSLNNIRIKIPNGDGEARIPFNYNYNIDVSLPNNNKVFFPELRASENNNEFLSRIIYSDQKIYNTRNNGLSKFRVGNIYDLDEGFGPIQKLQLIKDNLLSFQNSSIKYIPIEASIIEGADASQLAIRSSEVIGTPLSISNLTGCQNINTIAQSDSGIYFVDFNNKSVFFTSGRELTNISEKSNRTFFDQFLNDSAMDLHGVYDRENLEYLLLTAFNIGVLFSEKIDNWFTKLRPTFQGVVPQASRSAYSDSQGVVLCYRDTNNTTVHKTNDFNSKTFLGAEFDSSIEFSVNPNASYSKVYDVFTVNSKNPLSEISVSSNLGNTSMQVDFNNLREDSYRVPITRGLAGRVRGNHAIVNAVLRDGDNRFSAASSLLNINTAYRLSERKI
jgi:hypothetical protein